MPETAKRDVRKSGRDALDLTIAYVKQETIQPLRDLGWYLLAGIATSLFVTVGTVLLLVGVLRVLQDETGTALTGHWSWVPYVGVLVLAIVIMAGAAWRVFSGPGARHVTKTKGEAE